VRLYNALPQSNSSTAGKILRADMQLSSRCDDCWSSHILSAMSDLTQSYLFKERLLKCEPIDFGRFLLWTSGRGTWIIGIRNYKKASSQIDWLLAKNGLLDTLFWYTSMRAQQQMLHLPSMVRPPNQEGPGHTFAIRDGRLRLTVSGVNYVTSP